MSRSSIDYQAIEDHLLQAVPAAKSREDALDLVVAELKDKLPHYDWVGIYLLQAEILRLGPYRGEPSPHTEIPLHRGICGAAASQKETVVIPDVNAEPRYLACSIRTKSEIVVPIMHGATCLGEIDVDSHMANAFTGEDRKLLESIAELLARIILINE